MISIENTDFHKLLWPLSFLQTAPFASDTKARSLSGGDLVGCWVIPRSGEETAGPRVNSWKGSGAKRPGFSKSWDHGPRRSTHVITPAREGALDGNAAGVLKSCSNGTKTKTRRIALMSVVLAPTNNLIVDGDRAAVDVSQAR